MFGVWAYYQLDEDLPLRRQQQALQLVRVLQLLQGLQNRYTISFRGASMQA